MTAFDERWMRECIRLARRGEGFVSPNPMVGAVLVRKGRLLARGYHARYGQLHAEAVCLNRYRGDASGSDLYVNLEPCSHVGKTPPCADHIISRGVKRVIIGTADPNPLVAGRGIRRLRGAGITVTTGVLERECRELNRRFFRSVAERRPYVHVKIAQSVDGMIAYRNGGRKWITSRESRRLVHRWRAAYDAILVGAGTVRADDPRLTVRSVEGRDPAVIVLDGRCAIRPDARLFRAKRRVVVVVDRRRAERHSGHIAALARAGAEVLQLEGGIGGRIPLKQMLRQLFAVDVGAILVEGGRSVFSQFISSGLVDELSIFMAPVIIGDGIPVVNMSSLSARRSRAKRTITWSSTHIGRDLLIQAYAM